MARCAEYVIENPSGCKGGFQTLFKNGHPIHIEIGCGKGRFVIQNAISNPDVNYIAIERQKSVLLTALEQVKELALPNLLFINGDANNLTEYFNKGEISRIYINFCDPWPSNKHAKRRLTHGNFLKIYDEILDSNGEIHFKTDNEKLFEFSINAFSAASYRLSGITFDLHRTDIQNIMTEYEEKFAAQGLRIYRLEARKAASPTIAE